MSPAHLRTRSHLLGQAAIAVVLGYAVFAALWILLSDSVVETLLKDPEQIIRASMIKGWLFVAVTTLLLFVLVKRQIRLLNEAHQREIESFHARQHSHDLLSAIVENSVDAIYAKDKDGRFLLFNAAASRIVGKPSANVLGQDDRSLFPPEQASALVATDQSVMASGETLTTEENLETASGRRILLATKGPLRDARRNIIGTFGISRDITDIKRAEAALRQSEGKLRSIIRVAPTGIGVLHNRILREVNDALIVMSGYGREELIGQSSRILYPDDAEYEFVGREKYRQIVESGTGTVETRFRRKDGRIIDVLLSSTPIDPADPTQGVAFTALDITARKQAERILAESESRFRALVEQSAAGIYIMQDNQFCYVNPYFAQLAGYDSPQEIIDHVSFMDLVIPEQRAMIADKMRRRLAGDVTDNHYKVTGLRRDGTRIEVELHGTIIQYLGHPALIGLFVDVTARETAERELRASEQFKRAILDSVSDHIAVIDRTGMILAVNAPWQRFAHENDLNEEHFTQLAGVGSNYLDICHSSHGLSSDGAVAAEAGIRAVLSGTSASFSLEYPCHSPGVRRWFIMNVTPMGEGVTQGAVIAHTNITPRKLAEEELRTRNEELERFNRATVGREMDMIELKQRINALSLELGRAAPYDLGFIEPDSSQSGGSRGR